MAVKVQLYAENGISISKSPVYVGDEVTVTYNGLLVKSGADVVIIHMGYGENWDKKDYIPMEFDGESFKVTFKVEMAGTLNFAFKDSAENWDNNSAGNYSLKVAKKAVRATKAAVQEIGEKTTAKKVAAKPKTPAKKEAAAVKKTAIRTTAKKTVKNNVKDAETEK